MRLSELMTAHQLSDIVIYCPTINYRVFAEIMIVLKHHLQDQGFDVELRNVLYSYSPSTLYLLFLTHIQDYPFDFTRPYVLVNYEQCGSHWVKLPFYLERIRHALQVWDYSTYNQHVLTPLFGRELVVVPHSYHPVLGAPVYPDSKPIDILFYGALNPARQAFLTRLTTDAPELKVVSQFNYGCFGDKLVEAIHQSKIVLNIHYYNQPSVLEQSRIIPAIVHGGLVLSEHSDDVEADTRFENLVVFITLETVVETARAYLADPARLRAQTDKAFALLKAEMPPQL